MSVTLNGETREVPDGTTVKGLLEGLGLRGPAAVERNGEIVPRAQHPSVTLTDGDVLEVVSLVGGG